MQTQAEKHLQLNIHDITDMLQIHHASLPHMIKTIFFYHTFFKHELDLVLLPSPVKHN